MLSSSVPWPCASGFPVPNLQVTMGSRTTISSIFTTSCRSFGVQLSPRCTLASPLTCFPSKRSHKSVLPFCTSCSSERKFSCQSSKPGVAYTTASSSVTGHPEYNRLLPCPPYSSAPRIEHLVVSSECRVLDYICEALDLPPLYVADLIQFGAVHYALVCPLPPPTATPEVMRKFEEVTAPSVLKKRASIKGKTFREAQKTYRITHANQLLEPGMYLRVHVHPKRFPRCYDIDWMSRIIAVTESYVVLDKPAGTSVGGTTDNIEENCVTFTSRALGLTEPLMTTHQIDNCTEGCVVLARTKECCSVFHKMIREKKVKKLYLALAASPLPVGLITHYMRPVNIAPRLVSEERLWLADFVESWHLCQLEVLECKQIPWPNAATKEDYSVEDCGWPSRDYAYECKINLLTGRTHQIRAQLAACGAPLVGDSMYMPAAIAELTSPGLNPFGKYKEGYVGEDAKEMAVTEWIAQHGKEPTVCIGLQAFQISWDNGKHFFEAGSPWWRSGIA